MNLKIVFILAGVNGLFGCITADITEDQAAQAVVTTTEESCASTFSLSTGNMGGSGLYAIGAYPEAGRGQVLQHMPTVADIRAFITAQRALLDAPKHTIGTYCEGDKGADCHTIGPITCYLNISRVTGDLQAATFLAKACNQTSIARLESRGVAIISEAYGKPLGNGQPLVGAALAGCERARQGR